jgi:nitroreductase
MDFFEALEKRRSVRKYLPESVPGEVLDKAISAALLAPNSSNLQPWEIYRVTSPERRASLVTACFNQSTAATAAELVVFVARTDTWRRNRALILEELTKRGAPKMAFDYYQKIVPLMYLHGWLDLLGWLKHSAFSIIGLFRPVPRGPFSKARVKAVLSKTVALACENYMLAITAQGYSSCPMEGFDEVRVKKILGLGSESNVVMVISVGRENPEGIYGARLRLDPKLFVFEV